jgi:hypothetical protein
VTEESDSLGFNNARLTKRVAVLQEALEEEKARAASSSSWFGSGAKAELARVQAQLSVLQEELQVKIRENEELHMRIFETGQETGTIKEDLQERISKLRLEVKAKSEELEDLVQSNKHTVSRLTSENTTLQSRSEELSETLVRTKSLMQQREHTMTQAQQQLTSQLNSATSIIASKLPFNDTESEALNRLNLPPHDHSTVSKQIRISTAGITLFKKFIGLWKEWCDAEHEKLLYINRFSNETPDALKQINRKLGTLFADFPEVWSALASSYSIYMGSESLSPTSETAKQEVLVHFQAFVTLHGRTVSEIKARLEGESAHVKMFVSNESARTYNTALADNWTRAQSHLETLLSYFSIFCGATDVEHDVTSPAISNALYSLKRTYDTILVLKTLIKERATLTQQLASLEVQADAFLPNDVKVINNRRVTALTNASAMFDKICELVQEYIATLAVPNSVVRSAPSSFPEGLFALEPLVARSRSYLQTLHTTSNLNQRPSIPYEEQIKHVAQISEMTSLLRSKEIDITALRQQLVQHASLADKTAQEIRAAKETLAAKHASLQEALAEISELKQQIALHQVNVAQLGFTPPNSIQKSDTHSPSSSLPTTGTAEGFQLSNPKSLFGTDSHTDPSLPAYGMDSTLLGSQAPPAYNAASSAAGTFQPPSYASFLATTGNSGEAVSNPEHHSADLVSPYTASDLLADFGAPSSITATVAAPSGVNLVPSTSSGALGAELAPIARETASASPTPPLSASQSKQPWSLIVMGGDAMATSTSSLELGDPDRDREEQMRRYYEQRVQQFQAKVDSTDRKYIELHQQTMELEKRLKDTVAQREGLRLELESAARKQQAGLDELETTRLNYDQQLKMLTEHMVNLSDKISMYEEQLSALKNSTVRCGKCSAWNTIEWLMGDGKMGQRCRHGNHPSSFNYA